MHEVTRIHQLGSYRCCHQLVCGTCQASQQVWDHQVLKIDVT